MNTPAATARVGDSVLVTVGVDGATDLFAYQLSLTFDPAILKALTPNEGSLLPSAGLSIFVPGVVDNTLGSITFLAGSLLGVVPGVSGSGTLATVAFTAIAPGASAFSILLQATNGDGLFDSSFNSITAQANGASLTVLPAAAVPEPVPLALFVFGVAVLGVWRQGQPRPRPAHRRDRPIRSPRGGE